MNDQDQVVNVPDEKNSPIFTRRKFIGGVLLGGAAVVASHLLPPMPSPLRFLGLGPQKALADDPCLGYLCPTGCNCVYPVQWGVGCATMCGTGTCNDYFCIYPVWTNTNPGDCCCSQPLCRVVDIAESCDEFWCAECWRDQWIV